MSKRHKNTQGFRKKYTLHRQGFSPLLPPQPGLVRTDEAAVVSYNTSEYNGDSAGATSTCARLAELHYTWRVKGGSNSLAIATHLRKWQGTIAIETSDGG